MKIKSANIIIITLIAISFIAGVVLYPFLPDQLASHWNAQGEVDDYMSKFWGLFLMPIMTLGMYLLFIAIPKIDPLKKNIDKFRKYYDWLIVAIIAFMFYIHAFTLSWNLGYRFNVMLILIPAFAVLFYFIGVVLAKVKMNWFVGIRTPWTMSNEQVWDRTHNFASKLFKASGIIILLGLFFEKYAIWFVLAPAIGVAITSVIYSYFVYRRVKK